jgi:hypothetical protein
MCTTKIFFAPQKPLLCCDGCSVLTYCSPHLGKAHNPPAEMVFGHGMAGLSLSEEELGDGAFTHVHALVK